MKPVRKKSKTSRYGKNFYPNPDGLLDANRFSRFSGKPIGVKYNDVVSPAVFFLCSGQEKNCIEDNWDLSAKRAIAVVRVLQTRYNVPPERLTAGGRSFYDPKNGNDSAEGRSLNRRTDIVILPKLDQFFQMMEPGSMVESR